jgi:hypothetical protein
MLNLRDGLLTATVALPNGAAATTGASIDLGLGSKGETAWTGEFEIAAPALTTGQLPDTDTMTYDVIVSAAANLGTPTNVYPGILVQTGVGGTGAAAATIRFRLPFSPPATGSAVPATQRYLGLRSTNSGAGNASSKSATLDPVF